MVGRRRRCIPEQEEVRAFLARLSGADPEETQISAVFVGKDAVYKLKRAVRLPFLDFTSLQERKRFLDRELELNQPAAPGLYRDVVAITRTEPKIFDVEAALPPTLSRPRERVKEGGLELGGDGDVVDYALRMAPIPTEDFLLTRVKAGLSPGLLDELGDMVAADHARRSPVYDHDVSHPGRNARGNAKAALEAGLPPDAVAAWLAAAEAALQAMAPALVERAQAGFVRRAHGDLHLGNICIWQGAAVPFDALEFDEDMATIDLAYDLAFLLMDLDRRAGRPPANRVLNRYVARTGDAALVRLLPAFLSRRAMVRAHVTGDTTYLDAALAYLRPAPGRVVAIGGLPGTGKSTLARVLAPLFGAAPGALILRSDELRKRLHGVAPEQRLGPDAYTAEANARTDATLLDGVRAASSHGVIADATFLSPALRAAVADCGSPFTGIWLEAPLPELERRIASRHGDASDATTAVLHKLAAVDPGPIDWHRVPADETAPERCRVLLALSA